MADESRKKRKTPWGAIFWGAIGVAAGVRVLYRPHRALIKDGFVSACAGASCEPGMMVDSFEGQQALFAPMSGVVVDMRISSSTTSNAQSSNATATNNSLYIVPNGEAVLLEYTYVPGQFTPQVGVGAKLGVGQQFALAQRFVFSVYSIERNDAGGAKIGRAIEPASWLAVHGISVSAKKHPATQLWCEQGRKIVVPQAVANCGLALPAPSGYALLPISVTTG